MLFQYGDLCLHGHVLQAFFCGYWCARRVASVLLIINLLSFGSHYKQWAGDYSTDEGPRECVVDRPWKKVGGCSGYINRGPAVKGILLA